jgi:hypothetical protein
MQNYPPLNWKTSSSVYDGKGVVFHATQNRSPLEIEGTFHVSGDGQGMHIQYAAHVAGGEVTEVLLPVNQQVLESIEPAPKALSDAFAGKVAFVLRGIWELDSGRFLV